MRFTHLGMGKKSNEKSMVRTITQNTKGRPKKAKRCTAHGNQRKEKVNPSHGRKLSHPQPF
jgi:hypothetical protein